MGILQGFAPFIGFVVLNALAGPQAGLAAGLVISAILIGREILFRKTRPKILEAGTFILFGALFLFVCFASAPLSVIAVRFYVDAGLCLIVLASLLFRRPFTLQYAREQVGPELWGRPEFLRTNYVITSAWALAFAAMALAEAAILHGALPRRLGIVVIVLALVGAIKFTGWYPERARASGPRILG